ncbi:MAG: RNA-directed DNA polymerase [Fusobacteriaceae bacterium]
MKRRNYIFDKIVSIENIEKAHDKASKGKHHYSSVKMVDANKMEKSQEIINILKNGYKLDISDYNHEVILDKGKERDLYKLPYFPHRIIQWSIMNIVMDDFMKNFTSDTYASIKKRGIYPIVKKLGKELRANEKETRYCLKFDISKFYPSINNVILYSKIERKFKDKEFLQLMKTIIFSMGEKGIPIGSLLSQYLANFYLSSLDHYCKEILGLKHYFRYMDDIVILHCDKNYLHELKRFLDIKLKNEFDLTIKGNWQIFPVSARGIDFVGYRFFHNKTILRKRIYKNVRYVFSRTYKHKAEASYYGWCKYANVNTFRVKHNINKIGS